MDERHTQEALDALADLFLTRTVPPAKPAPRGQDAPSPTPRSVTPPSATPASGTLNTAAPRSPSESSDPLSGPSPLRLPPRPEPHEAGSNGGNGHGSNGGIAGRSPLRLAEPASPSALFRPRATLEAALLGNLPGFAGPWLAQYASQLAASEGPIGLLRLQDSKTHVEVIAPRGTLGPQAAAGLVDEVNRLDAPAHDLAARMRLATTVLGIPIRRWIVQLASPADGRALGLHRHFHQWTLLCGADEAAQAQAFRQLKDVLAEFDEQDPADRELDLGVAVMGAEPVKAAEVSTLMDRAARRQLGLPLGPRVAVQRMGPLSAATLGETDGAAWPTVQRFLQQLEPPPASQVEPSPIREPAREPAREPRRADAGPMAPRRRRPAPPPEPQGLAASLDPAEWEALLGTPMPEAGDADLAELAELSEFSQADASPEMATDAPRGRSASPRDPLMGEIGAHREHKHDLAHLLHTPARAAPVADPGAAKAPQLSQSPSPALSPSPEPDLVGLLTDQDIRAGVALEARCPRHPGTALVLDEAGRMHLLARHRSPRPGASRVAAPAPLDLDGLRAAWVALLDARAWVIEHAPLLRLTQRQFRFDPDAEPVLHLFTDDPRSASALAAPLAQAIRFHLLIETPGSQGSQWLRMPLN